MWTKITNSTFESTVWTNTHIVPRQQSTSNVLQCVVVCCRVSHELCICRIFIESSRESTCDVDSYTQVYYKFNVWVYSSKHFQSQLKGHFYYTLPFFHPSSWRPCILVRGAFGLKCACFHKGRIHQVWTRFAKWDCVADFRKCLGGRWRVECILRVCQGVLRRLKVYFKAS